MKKQNKNVLKKHTPSEYRRRAVRPEREVCAGGAAVKPFEQRIWVVFEHDRADQSGSERYGSGFARKKRNSVTPAVRPDQEECGDERMIH